MKKYLVLPIALSACALPSVAIAQDSAATTPVQAVPIDPARVDAARSVVDRIFPEGTYARMMDGPMTSMMDSFVPNASAIPMKDVARMAGLDEDQIARIGPSTVNDMMLILDPHHDERMKRMMRAMMGEMSKILVKFEPGIREGLAQAYARRFTAGQLLEMKAFFDTPTGKAYASELMFLFMDPEVMQSMQAFMPEMTKSMPAMMATLEASTTDLPKPRSFNELSQADRQKLAELLGVPAEQLRKGKKRR